eukprot:142540_1
MKRSYLLNHIKRILSTSITETEIKGEQLYGPYATYSALINRKRSNYYHLYAINNSENNDNHKHNKIIELCESMKIPITYCNKSELRNLISLHRHNGFVLNCDPITIPLFESNPITFGKIFGNKINIENTQIWVAIEQARNQDNLGSILRSCLYFGINGILYSTIESVPLSPIVARTSCGALDWLDIRLCCNKLLNIYLNNIKNCNHLMEVNIKI